jgi:hypothetical protein
VNLRAQLSSLIAVIAAACLYAAPAEASPFGVTLCVDDSGVSCQNMGYPNISSFFINQSGKTFQIETASITCGTPSAPNNIVAGEFFITWPYDGISPDGYFDYVLFARIEAPTQSYYRGLQPFAHLVPPYGMMVALPPQVTNFWCLWNFVGQLM